MANNIENQVVRIDFDNSKFRRGVESTMSALANLKKSLSFKQTDTGLDELADKASKVNVDNLSQSVDGVSKSFIAMSTIAITALAKVTSKAIDAGANLTKSLTLDPILDGFREYELNMNSIQTILANTRKDGTTLQDVNAALDELNEYSDLTIYNFAQMTKNIGAATAAGVDLETATTMVKGFANSAAIAGVDATAMAGALEQMTQSLAAGVVKAQDWISLERRGLAGQVQQEAFFEMAKAAGTLADVPLDQTFEQWQDAGNTLRGSLQDGWLTADVFNQTMKVFSGEMTEAELAAMGMSETVIAEMLELGEVGVEAATKVRTFTALLDTAQESVASGWSGTFRILVGDFEEASDLFSDLSTKFGDAVGASAEARNKVLQGAKDLGARDDLMEGLANSFKAIMSVINPIKDAFRQIFPRKTAEELAAMAKRFKEFTEGLILSEGTAGRVQRIFAGFFAAIKIGVEIFKFAARVVRTFFSALTSGGSGPATEVLAKLGDAVVRLQEYLSDGGLEKGFDKVSGAVTRFAQIIRTGLSKAIDFLGRGLDYIRDQFNKIDWEEVWERIQAFANNVKGFAEDVLDGLSPLIPVFDYIKQTITSLFSDDVDAPKEVQAAAKTTSDAANQLGDAIARIKKQVGDFFDLVSRVATSIKDFGSSVITKVREAFSGLFDGFEIPEPTGNLWGGVAAALGAGFIAMLGLLTKTISKGFDTGIFGSGFKNFGDSAAKALDGVTGVLKGMQQNLQAQALIKIAIAIGILAASIAVLSLIPGGKIAASMTAMTVGLAQMVATLKLLSTFASNPAQVKGLLQLSAALVVLSVGVFALSLSIKILGSMNMGELAIGLTGVAGALGIFIGAMKLGFADADNKGMLKAAATMLVLGLAMIPLAAAMKIFGSLNFEEIGKGLLSVGGSVGIMVAAINLLDTSGAQKAGATMMGIAVSMLFIAAAVKAFGSMSLEEIGKGFLGISALLVALVASVNMIDVDDMAKVGLGILLISFGLKNFAKAVEKMGGLDLPTIGRGLLGIGGVLVALGVAMKSMEKSSLGAVALFFISLSLEKLTKTILVMAEVPIYQLLTALGALAATLFIIVGAALALTPAMPVLYAFAAAIAAVGIGIAGIGAGFYLMAEAFRIASKITGKNVDQVLDVFRQLLKFLPELAKALAKFAVDFAKGFLEGALTLLPLVSDLLGQLIALILEKGPELVEAGVTILSSLIEGAKTVIPQLIELGFTVLTSFLKNLQENIGIIVEAGVGVLLGFIRGITNNIGEIVPAVAELILKFGDAVITEMPRIIAKGVEILVNFLKGITENLDTVVPAVVDFITKLIDSVAAELPRIIESGVGLLTAFLKGIADSLDDIIPAVGEVVTKFIEEVGNLAEDIAAAGLEALVDFLGGVTGGVTEIVEAVGRMVTEFTTALGNQWRTIMDAGVDLLEDIIDGIDEALERLIPAAVRAATKFLDGLVDEAIDFVGKALAMVLKLLAGIRQAINDNQEEFANEGRRMAEAILGAMLNALTLGIPNAIAQAVIGTTTSPIAWGVGAAVEQETEPVGTQDGDSGDTRPVISPVPDRITGRLPSSTAGTRYAAEDISQNFGPGGFASRGGDTINNNTTNNFNQTNNSPEPLDARTIYRETGNLLERRLQGADS